MYRAAIFDLDGTLLNTLDDLAAAGNHALAACGFPMHKTESYKLFVGNGISRLIERAVPHGACVQQVAMVEAVFRRYYATHSFDRTQPYSGIRPVLRAIRQTGAKTAVLTNKAHDYLPELMERFFPGLIDIALGGRKQVPLKPSPAGLFEILDRLGYKGEECLYIGDSAVDILTGKEAGCKTVGVSWGFRSVQELSLAGAERIIDKPEEILTFFIDK